MSEEDLRLLFSNTGGTVKAFKFFQYVSEIRCASLHLNVSLCVSLRLTDVTRSLTPCLATVWCSAGTAKWL